MLDFLMISTRMIKHVVEIYPKFIIKNSKDLMIRGGDFYAIWLEELNMWSTNEEDAIRLIDSMLDKYHRDNKEKFEDNHVRVQYMWDAETGMIDRWHKYCQKQLRDNYKDLDKTLIFADQTTKKTDYASKKLNYALDAVGTCESYDELISTLYEPEERHKIEWCIGAVLTGDSKRIHKFAAFYGPPGTGKSTILDIVEKLFDGYVAMFKAESLGSSSDLFALAQFKTNPLVAISHDADLSRIENNTTLNSLISHEKMVVNEKHKGQYEMRFNSFLFLGTNKVVKITDAKSGLLRRLIDIHPSGNTIPFTKYSRLVNKIDFELGAIAAHCRQVYLDNKTAYDDYKPTLMLSESNDFYNFVSDSYQIFKNDDSTTLKSSWEMYKQYCEEARVPYPLTMRAFAAELKNYFKDYQERVRVGEEWYRSYYSGFKIDIFENENDYTKTLIEEQKSKSKLIAFKEQKSKLDIVCANCSAQYSTDAGIPKRKWSEVTTVLSDLDTSKLHYLKVPDNHIVIDFDIKNENGEKDYDKNLEEASKWPKTYAEVSKSGGGIHLHYIYNGDASTLSRIYADNIEIKVFTGNSSLRRMLTKCNNEDINTISSGLPIKENAGKMISFEAIKTERALRTIVKKNLNKEYHPATKPSIDFIFKVLNDAYNDGMKYDLSDMHGAVLAFAASSSNQSEYCLKLVPKMKFKSEEDQKGVDTGETPIVFYDVEVFPNLIIVNWKLQGRGKSVRRMINPTPKEIEALMKYRLIGFNCRRYDNHIIYAILLGYTIEQVYKLSQKIINEKQGFFGAAYNISYTDIHCYSRVKQSLKKWQVQLGIIHKELGLPWDQPVPEHMWSKVAEYCDNDVISTEIVFDNTQGDFIARLILADIADATPNTTTNTLTTSIVFGNQWGVDTESELKYVDLSREFPGYEFVKEWDDTTKKFNMANMYRDVDVSFGGYVYAEPGMYTGVGLLDIESMHPFSIIVMNLFGKYTPRFAAIVYGRLAIKHNDIDEAVRQLSSLINDEQKINKYFNNPSESLLGSLSYALKIAINAVYGLTSATFKNKFKHPQNENNIVALRGALFMKTLQDELTTRLYKVVHIKTDSIKVPQVDQNAIDICMNMAKRYGYRFEHETTYDRFCLVNDAVYVAKHGKTGKHANKWIAVGTQFAVPYVFKKLFSHEAIEFADVCEVKEVTTSAIYLRTTNGDDTNLKFIGKVGLFCPVKEGIGGGDLVRNVLKKTGNVEYDSIIGTKGYLWMEADDVYNMIDPKKPFMEEAERIIDFSYYNSLVDKAFDTLNKFGDAERFLAEEDFEDDSPPWDE